MRCHNIWEINPNFPPQNPKIGQAVLDSEITANQTIVNVTKGLTPIQSARLNSTQLAVESSCKLIHSASGALN